MKISGREEAFSNSGSPLEAVDSPWWNNELDISLGLFWVDWSANSQQRSYSECIVHRGISGKDAMSQTIYVENNVN